LSTLWSPPPAARSMVHVILAGLRRQHTSWTAAPLPWVPPTQHSAPNTRPTSSTRCRGDGVTIGGLHTTDSSASAPEHGEQRTAAQSITGNEFPSHRGISPPPQSHGHNPRALLSLPNWQKRPDWWSWWGSTAATLSLSSHLPVLGNGVFIHMASYSYQPQWPTEGAAGRGVVHIADADHEAEDFGLRFRWKGYEERWKIWRVGPSVSLPCERAISWYPGRRSGKRKSEQMGWYTENQGVVVDIDDQHAGPARSGTGPGKHGPWANGPARVYGLNGPCLESSRAWPLAQARPSRPLFVPGQLARHAKKTGRASTSPPKFPNSRKYRQI
jgi:hypothetical protein